MPTEDELRKRMAVAKYGPIIEGMKPADLKTIDDYIRNPSYDSRLIRGMPELLNSLEGLHILDKIVELLKKRIALKNSSDSFDDPQLYYVLLAFGQHRSAFAFPTKEHPEYEDNLPSKVNVIRLAAFEWAIDDLKAEGIEADLESEVFTAKFQKRLKDLNVNGAKHRSQLLKRAGLRSLPQGKRSKEVNVPFVPSNRSINRSFKSDL